MAKTNFFEGFKDNGSKVAKYVYNRAMKKGLSMQYNDLIKAEQKNLAEYDTLKGSVLEEQRKSIDAIKERISALEKERDEQIEKYKYVMPQEDKDLRKQVREATNMTKIRAALRSWLKVQFNLTATEDGGFINDVVRAAGDKINWKLFNETDGTRLTEYNVNNLLTMAYYKLYERLVELDFIKAVDVPAPMRDHYEKIKKAKDMKKQLAKARKGKTSTVSNV